MFLNKYKHYDTMFKSGSCKMTFSVFARTKGWRALGQFWSLVAWMCRSRWGSSAGRRSQGQAGLREGLFGCSTQWVSCWEEVWTQFVSVVNLITASMKRWSHREQVPLTVEPWFKTWSLRHWPCASCSFSSTLYTFLIVHFYFLPPLALPLFLCHYQWIICNNGRADVTKGLQDSLAGPLFHGWPSRSFMLPPGWSLAAPPPSVRHTCLDQSGQIGFNNLRQNAP